MELTRFDHAVMSAIRQLDGNAYGTTIWRAVDFMLGKSTSVGALYKTLDKLEERGMVTTRMGEASSVQGGRAKRYFRLNGVGDAALEAANAQAERILEGQRKGLGGLKGALDA